MTSVPCGFTVGFDKRAATLDATQHLIVLGHRRFGLLSAPTEGNERALERGAGVAAALAQAGLTLPDAYRRCGAISLGSASTLMHGPRALPQRPTAVVATHDVFAVGSLLACR